MLYLIVYFMLAPRFSEIIANRKKVISSNIESAEAAIKEAKRIREEIENRLNSTMKKANIYQHDAEVNIRNMIEKGEINAEKSYLETLKREDEKLDIWYNKEVSAHLPEISRDLRDSILAKLLNKYSDGTVKQ